MSGVYWPSLFGKFFEPVLEGGGGRGAGKEEEKGFYLAALHPSCEQVFISSSGDHSHHHHSLWWPLETPVLVHVSLVLFFSAQPLCQQGKLE